MTEHRDTKKLNRAAASVGKNQQSSPRPKRDPAAIKQAMLSASGNNPKKMGAGSYLLDPRGHKDIGLPLGDLEDHRWRISPSVARAKLHEVGLPYEGRRAGLIYSWPSIFRTEGVDTELAKNALLQPHHYLFDNMVDTAEAAAFLGFRDTSSIRKLVSTGQLSDTAYIQFGSRGVYRFRPEALRALQKNISVGRVV